MREEINYNEYLYLNSLRLGSTFLDKNATPENRSQIEK